MESSTSRILLVLMTIVVVLLLSRGTGADEEEDEAATFIVTREFERIPLRHALATLEEIVKEERSIKDFCYTHFFDATRRYEKCQNNSDAKTKEDSDQEPPCGDVKPTSCADLFNGGVKTSGTYKVQLTSLPSPNQVEVYCDMETDGGGWTVFLRRGPYPPHINFTRNWNDYAQGFGSLNEEFWLGNEKIHALTDDQLPSTVLRVDLEDFRGNKRYAKHQGFRVGSVEENYKLHVGKYEGDAVDNLSYNQGNVFATYDRNDDVHECAKKFRGGWWWATGGCHTAKLTGIYNNTEHGKGVNWGGWLGHTYSLKGAQMKLRPESFDPKRTLKLC